jgi:hypothetical protein
MSPRIGRNAPMRNYEPADFLSKLSKNNLPNPTEVSIVGLVKSDEANPSAIHFSYSLPCEQWLSIPIEIVETIDHLGTVPCKDHQHPLVRIKFKRPDETREDVAFLFNLISQMQASLARALRVVRTRKRSDTSLARQPHLVDFCFIWDDPHGVMVCCFHGDELECTGIV